MERPLTRAANARLAGSMFLVYIALGLAGLILFDRSSAGADPAARLEAIAAHVQVARIALLLSFLTGFVALALGVALYALTRDTDPDLACSASPAGL